MCSRTRSKRIVILLLLVGLIWQIVPPILSYIGHRSTAHHVVCVQEALPYRCACEDCALCTALLRCLRYALTTVCLIATKRLLCCLRAAGIRRFPPLHLSLPSPVTIKVRLND